MTTRPIIGGISLTEPSRDGSGRDRLRYIAGYPARGRAAALEEARMSFRALRDRSEDEGVYPRAHIKLHLAVTFR
jgi:hypothetical protein